MLVATMIWVLARTVPFVSIVRVRCAARQRRHPVRRLRLRRHRAVAGGCAQDRHRASLLPKVLLAFPAISVRVLAHQILGRLYSRDYTGPNVPVVEIGGSAVGTHLAGAASFCPDRLPKGVLAVGRCLVWHAGHDRRDQSGRYAGRPCAAHVRDVHAGTSALDADRAGGGIGIFAVLYAVEAAFIQYEEAKESRSSVRSARTRSSRTSRASSGSPGSRRRERSSGVSTGGT